MEGYEILTPRKIRNLFAIANTRYPLFQNWLRYCASRDPLGIDTFAQTIKQCNPPGKSIFILVVLYLEPDPNWKERVKC